MNREEKNPLNISWPATTPTPRSAGWKSEGISTPTSILREERVTLELLWCYVIVAETLAPSVAMARRCHDRTNDYHQIRYQNRTTIALLCVQIKASQVF
jgi:hypothetical protein